MKINDYEQKQRKAKEKTYAYYIRYNMMQYQKLYMFLSTNSLTVLFLQLVQSNIGRSMKTRKTAKSI